LPATADFGWLILAVVVLAVAEPPPAVLPPVDLADVTPLAGPPRSDARADRLVAATRVDFGATGPRPPPDDRPPVSASAPRLVDLDGADLAAPLLETLVLVADFPAAFPVAFPETLPFLRANANKCLTSWSFRMECQPDTPLDFAIRANSLLVFDSRLSLVIKSTTPLTLLVDWLATQNMVSADLFLETHFQ